MRAPLCALLLAACLALPAQAERADRNRPINIEADRVEVDDLRQESVFTGNVVITQGTMMIRADRVILRQDKQGFQFGIAFGKPAYFKQRREGLDEWVEGWALKLEYDGRKETVQFFEHAKLRRTGGDEVRGDYMIFEMATEVFRALGGKSMAAANNPEGRVRAVLQPRARDDKDKGGDKPAAGAALKPSAGIAHPRD
jgi:lipopolysaccharide export system protein LptA